MVEYGNSVGDEPFEFSTNITRTDFEFAKQKGWKCSCCGLRTRPSKQVPSGYFEVLYVEGQKQLMCAFCATALNLKRNINGKRSLAGYLKKMPGVTQAQASTISFFITIGKLRYKGTPNIRKFNEINDQILEAPSNLTFIGGSGSGLDQMDLEDVDNAVKLFELFRPDDRHQLAPIFEDVVYFGQPSAFAKQCEYYGKAYANSELEKMNL